MPGKTTYLKKKSYAKSGKEATSKNAYEDILLQAINYSIVRRSTRELAEATEMDWATANKYLNRLKERGLIKATKIGENKVVWSKK